MAKKKFYENFICTGIVEKPSSNFSIMVLKNPRYLKIE